MNRHIMISGKGGDLTVSVVPSTDVINVLSFPIYSENYFGTTRLALFIEKL